MPAMSLHIPATWPERLRRTLLAQPPTALGLDRPLFLYLCCCRRHYTIDPLILAVSGKTWATLSVEDRNIVREVGAMMMELQKDEARDAPVKPAKLLQLLQDMYGRRWFAPPRATLMHSDVKPVLSLTSGPKKLE